MVSVTPDIIPFVSPIKAEVLTQMELDTVKGKTLQLLSEVGVHFPSSQALEIFAENGAQVDRTNEIVRLPADLVEKAMSKAPRSFILGGREERLDLLLDGSCSYLCTDGTGVHVVDMETREKRPSCKRDPSPSCRPPRLRTCVGIHPGRVPSGCGDRSLSTCRNPFRHCLTNSMCKMAWIIRWKPSLLSWAT